ncbi:adaptor protein complex AP-1 small subunit [Entophlyctis helioformis]|nr:adaptor protein complex AP-1 small subunit [Entophlyctis helioformis]
MGVRFLLLVSRQGKIRLTKWFTADWGGKEKAKIVKDVSQMVLARKTKMCNVLEFKEFKVVYRRYASLFFVVGTDIDENELLSLEIIHRYVEILDKWFMNVCELDIIFNYQQAYTILDELLIAGELEETSKRAVLNTLKRIDETEKQEIAAQPSALGLF